VSVGPTRVRVRTVGSGPPLLMIMGLGGNLDMWAPLAKRLTGRQLIMFDFPGTGGSGMSCLPPTMGANALFTRWLLGRLGYDRIDVLGYSWGGVLAQHLAIQHPRTVRRLILAGTTFGVGGIPPGPRVAARMLTPRRYYSRDYFTKVAPEIYGGRFRHDDVLVNDEANRRIGRPPGIAGYTAQLIAVMGYSSLPGLPFISAPTLILAGDDDPIVAIANQKMLARFIRHSRLHIVPGAGHLLLLDSPDVAAPLILEHLSAGDASAGSVGP
jgi:poly(3-hydroxyoctanoate) depolymerase